MSAAGYSNTPLDKKLGLKEGFTIALINPPPYYFGLFTSWPPGLKESENLEEEKDFIHFFTKSKDELFEKLPSLSKQIKQKGIIWVSWPKKASKVVTDLDGNIVRGLGLKTGLVDIKVCSVDSTWSGLKFVIPVKDRKIK